MRRTRPARRASLATTLVLVLVLVLTWPGAAARAQALPDVTPPAPRPGDADWLPPPLPEETPSGPEFALPAVPEADAEAPLSAGPRFVLREVRVVGNTVLDEAEIRAAVGPFLNTEVGTGTLETLRRALTRLYVEAGYINSGAVLPDQRIANGRVVFAMVEGHLTGVDVAGTEALAPGYVRARLADLTDLEGRPLNVADIERRLQLLLRDPVIERVNAALEPGAVAGEARLRARVTEAPPFALEATLANSESESVGSIRAGLSATVRNLTGGGDILRFDLGKTEHMDEVAAHWSVPLTPADTRLELSGQVSRADVHIPDFGALDIDSTTWTVRLGVTHPLIRTPAAALRVGGALERRRSQTYLFDRPFPLSAGTDDGRTDLAVLRLTQSWSHAQPSRAVGLRSTFSIGLPFPGTTDEPGAGPDSTFLSWLGQGQVVQRVFGETRLVGRITAQWADQSLFSMERLAIGGRTTVRGYRENTLVRDAGVVVSAEAQVPVGRLALPGISPDASDGQVTAIPFVDFARAWNVEAKTPDPGQIAGVGLGLRWDLAERTQAELFYGHALTDVERPGEALQDLGLHFRLRVGLY